MTIRNMHTPSPFQVRRMRSPGQGQSYTYVAFSCLLFTIFIIRTPNTLSASVIPLRFHGPSPTGTNYPLNPVMFRYSQPVKASPISVYFHCTKFAPEIAVTGPETFWNAISWVCAPVWTAEPISFSHKT